MKKINLSDVEFVTYQIDGHVDFVKGGGETVEVRQSRDLSVNFRINLLVLINLKVGPASGKRLRQKRILTQSSSRGVRSGIHGRQS